MPDKGKENIEIELLITALQLKYGFKFTQFSKSILHRKINNLLKANKFRNIYEVIETVLNNQEIAYKIITQFSVTDTEMFRDPPLYKKLRTTILPRFKYADNISILHLGCSTAEETFSLSILLQEEAHFNKSKIYATDLIENIFNNASSGKIERYSYKLYEENYKRSGGKSKLSNYYNTNKELLKFNKKTCDIIEFKEFDHTSCTFQKNVDIVFCRNVLIYYQRELQKSLLHYISSCLKDNGILILGTREPIDYLDTDLFRIIDPELKIFKKIQY